MVSSLFDNRVHRETDGVTLLLANVLETPIKYAHYRLKVTWQ